MGDVGVIDREHLEYTLLGQCTPVDHFLQIAEVAHTETAFTAQ